MRTKVINTVPTAHQMEISDLAEVRINVQGTTKLAGLLDQHDAEPPAAHRIAPSCPAFLPTLVS